MNLFIPINRDVVIYLRKYVQHLTFDFFKETGNCSAWWLSPSSSDEQKKWCSVGTEKELWGFGASEQSWKIVWGMQQWSGVTTIWVGRRYFVMTFRSHTHSALAWVTQPPWLHQFRFGWTSAHPITKSGAVTEVESHFLFWARPSRDFFFHLQTYPAHPTTLFKKNIPTYLAPLPMLRIFFFQNSLSFCCIVIVAAANWKNGAIICCHHWCSKKN
jgi:hypothetical protein